MSDDILGRGTDEDANHNTEGQEVGSHGDTNGMFAFIYVLLCTHISRQNLVCLKS